MELRAYWQIVGRRWWLVVGLTALAVAASVIIQPQQALTYKASVRLTARPQFEVHPDQYSPGQNAYYEYVFSEYLWDDVSEMVRTGSFLADVQGRLRARPGGPPPGTLEARKTHRVLTLSATSATPEGARLLAEAAAQLLTEPRNKYVAAVTPYEPAISVVDPPALAGPGPQARSYLNLLLRALLGLFAGVGLAFLMEYLDETVRSAPELEALLGLPVLGELPPEARRWQPGKKRG